MNPESAHWPGSVQQVVKDQLCTQCGICISLCPVQAIMMCETPAGMLVPSVQEEKCVRCGLCRLACPGAELHLDSLGDNDPFKGNIRRAFIGHARDDSLRFHGQSGGVVSALLLFLIESGRIDSALVTSMPKNGSLRPSPMLARTMAEILAAQGSKYCPAAPGALLGSIQEGERTAFVGISCQMHGVQRLAELGNPLVSGICYRIGLFCDRTLCSSCIDEMARQAHIRLKDVLAVEYRSKRRNGWPGEVCFDLISGERLYFPPSLRTSLKDFFTPPRCRLCFDKLNVFSDLSLGDSWGVSGSFAGDSVVLVRNETGESLVCEAVTEGYLQVEEIDVQLVILGQNIEKRRCDFSSFMRLAGRSGRKLPEYKSLLSDFWRSRNEDLDTANMRSLNYSVRISESATRKIALAKVFRWRMREKAVNLPLSLLEKSKGWLRRILAVSKRKKNLRDQ